MSDAKKIVLVGLTGITVVILVIFAWEIFVHVVAEGLAAGT